MGRILREADVPHSRTRRREAAGIDALITVFQIPTPATTLVKAQESEAPPVCVVHQVPMVRLRGRKGPF